MTTLARRPALRRGLFLLAVVVAAQFLSGRADALDRLLSLSTIFLKPKTLAERVCSQVPNSNLAALEELNKKLNDEYEGYVKIYKSAEEEMRKARSSWDGTREALAHLNGVSDHIQASLAFFSPEQKVIMEKALQANNKVREVALAMDSREHATYEEAYKEYVDALNRLKVRFGAYEAASKCVVKRLKEIAARTPTTNKRCRTVIIAEPGKPPVTVEKCDD